MTNCWQEVAEARPSFQELLERLEEMMLQEEDYFDFNKVDESKDYYAVQELELDEETDNEIAETRL